MGNNFLKMINSIQPFNQRSQSENLDGTWVLLYIITCDNNSNCLGIRLRVPCMKRPLIKGSVLHEGAIFSDEEVISDMGFVDALIVATRGMILLERFLLLFVLIGCVMDDQNDRGSYFMPTPKAKGS